MTYEEITETLRSNHIYPASVVKSGKICELHVECPSLVLMDSKKARVEEILAGANVKISKMPNEGYILIKLKK